MFRQLSSHFITTVCRRQMASNLIRINAKKLDISLLNAKSTQLWILRHKHVTSGVQGRRNSKTPPKKKDADEDEYEFYSDNTEVEESLKDSEYEALASEALGKQRSIQNEENILVIQPYIKWGPQKSNISPDIKLQESEDLIRSLDAWKIVESIKVPLVGFAKRTFFGRGKVDELKRLAKKYNHDPNQKITGIFVSISRLHQMQKFFLEMVFGVPVMDRFSIVIQILRAHATTREAKLQIALAELPYIWHHLGSENNAIFRSQLTDSQKMMLRNRERRIKTELEHIRLHRKVTRQRRLNREFPIVAVVGYTNAGKTSLIKALTQQEKLEPKNQLFATLDVTAHMGRLPCNLQVLFIDTIGFMSDIPTDLIECFITTLDDAMNADLIIHIQDMAHINVDDQRQHVEKTLRRLMLTSESEKRQLLENVINVGNKCDLVDNLDDKNIENLEESSSNQNETAEPMHFVSCTKGSGLSELLHAIEKNILTVTNRKKMIFRVRQGGDEYAWLYKNTAVINTEICDKNSEYLKVHVLLTDLALTQFKNTFLKTKRQQSS